MKTKIGIYTLFIFSTFLFTGNLFAIEKSDLTQEIYIKSGLAKQIPQIQLQFSAYLTIYQNKLPEKVMGAFRREIKRIYNPSSLEKRIKQSFQSNLDKNTILQVLKWLDSPLGKKITQLEEQASTPEEVQKMIAYIKSDPRKHTSKKRVNLVEKLNILTHSTEMATDTGIFIGLSVLNILNDINPNTPKYTRDQLQNHIKNKRLRIRSLVQNQIILTFLYTYQKLSDRELEKYIEFATTKTSRLYHKVIMKAFLGTLIPKADLI
ncbi:MAG: 3-methyladenine DNA glycosylase AlkC [bacterium]|jgi:3-methyladenine DNA glycosylase AlkC